MQSYSVVFGLTAAYFLLILSFVFYARIKSTKNFLPGLDEFFLAGKNLSPLVLTFTAVGSLFSTFTVLGVPGLAYVHGTGAILFYVMLHSTGILLFAMVAKKMRRFADGKRIFSPYEIISNHYNSRKLGLFLSIVITIFLMPYIALQLVGIGAFIHSYTDGAINYITGVGSMMLVIFIYLFLGGMRAVAYTDFVQIMASFIGLIAGLWFLFTHFDLSVFSVFTKIREISPQHLTLTGAKDYYTWPILLSVSLVTASIYLQPHILTRALMAKDDSQINYMTVGIIMGFLLTATLGLLFGLSIYAAYGADLQPNFVMGHVFKDLGTMGLLGLIVSGLMLLGALGAAMSTADSLLISIGQITTRDMVRPFFQITPERQVVLSKIVMTVVLIASFLTGLKPPQFMTDLAIYSAVGSAVMIPTILSFQWKRRCKIAAFTSITSGLAALAFAVIFKVKTGNDFLGLHEGTLPLALSVILFYGICLLKKKGDYAASS